jgi:F-type H+-transporting ATPase subunit b
MDINLTLIGQTIAMIVFVVLCMKLIWPPILGAIEQRQVKIAQGLAAARQGQEKLEQAQAVADEIIADARRQAIGILEQANARAKEIVAEGKADGVRERGRQLAAAKAEIEQGANRARDELRSHVSAIVIAGVEKILKREVDVKAHEKTLGTLLQLL